MANGIELDVSELEALGVAMLMGAGDPIKKLAEDLMRLVRDVAAANTPIFTGEMRSRWFDNNLYIVAHKQGNVYTVTIENDAYQTRGYHPHPENRFYASFVEEGYMSRGGRWIPGHWMMAKGETEAERQAQGMFDAIILDWWRHVSNSRRAGRLARARSR